MRRRRRLAGADQPAAHACPGQSEPPDFGIEWNGAGNDAVRMAGERETVRRVGAPKRRGGKARKGPRALWDGAGHDDCAPGWH